MRLEKYLSDCGIGSRKDVKKIIESGKVAVNGKVVKIGSSSVSEGVDIVTFNGKELVYKKYYYYIMNKPMGCVTAKEDNRDKTVMEYLPEWVNKKDLSPVGRLDKDTEGLLLFTNDGESAHNMMSPKKHIDKVYFCSLQNEINEEAVKCLEQGVVIDGTYKTKEATVQVLSQHEILLTITEGKFHQVKKMLEAVGNKVIYLQRRRFGKYDIGNMQTGEVKEIRLEDII